MTEYLATAFSGPPLVASCLLALVTCYWLFVILGAVGIEALDFDLDFDADVDAGDIESMISVGMLPLKWLNIGRVPLMIWLSVFALAFWLTSMLWDTPAGREDAWNMAAVILRNGAIGLLATKIVTQPLCDVFTGDRGVTGDDLVGLVCEPTTRVSENKGQAKVETGTGTPLLLSIRCEHGELEKGERAQIVSYDRDREIYIVRRA